MRTVLRLLLMPVLAVLLMLSQGAMADSSSSSHRKVVATTFTVIQDMAQNVAGDKLEVVSITPPGAEIHDYEPTPQDIIKARSADLVLWNGLGLERWFERFYGNLKSTPVAVLSEGVKPMSLREGPYEGQPNPHGWISPANAAIYVNNIRDAFIKLDPSNADTYRANAEHYNQQIAALNKPIADQLARIPKARRQLASCEGAFSYLARDYGFKELYLWAVNSEEEGTPSQVRNVVDEVKHNKVPVVFCESTVSDRAMKQVASESGAAFGGVLYVDSLSKKDGPVPDYLSMLRHNANTIVKGFGVDSK
ncbi:metal ABC transporter substrate-binding protein [Carnimonas bestiolae]|uniref:metal ABC transporter substrate-binding protein n=1 Tax=Carnimonas bestiolae TaxID=3402172 RepID=UPI003EDB80B9